MSASSEKHPSRALVADSPPGIESQEFDVTASELEWLLEIGPPLLQPGSRMSAQARRGRLSRLLGASMKHMDCELAALISPARNLRLIEASARTPKDRAERLFGELAPPLLKRFHRKPKIVLGHRARAASSPPLRLLAMPLATRVDRNPGALLWVRSVEAPRFSRVHMALARHLGSLIVASFEYDLDAATGLHTRVSLQGELESWRSPEHTSGGSHAIVSIKIDRLDAINKMSGFDAGDAIIGAVAGVLEVPHLPSGALAARISGGEFAVVLPHTAPEQAQDTAQSIQQTSAALLSGPATSGEPISLSCGIASFDSTEDFEGALALAQLAGRTARKRGTGRIEVYQDADVSMIQRHTDIIAVQQLREALREDRLTLFAQRIMPLRETAEAGGYELLLRSLDDLAENRAPLRLLSAAHRNHLAATVDLWVVEHALAEALTYRSELKEGRVSLSINITGPSLTDQRFLERIHGLIGESGIEPRLITFEITETVAVLSLAKAIAFIQETRALGCRFALDDFGTGVNSLKNLTSLPVDRVKIDGSFVADLLTNRQSEAMVRAIVSLARDFGIDTVAEYAESSAIVDRLRDLGVQYAQGYGIERPRPLADVLKEVRRDRRTHA